MKRALAIVVVILLAARAASAQTRPDDVRRADQLFQEGQRLMDAKHVDEACARYTESEKLDPQLGTLLNLADCHDQEGRTATAHEEYRTALALAVERHDTREGFARSQLADVEKRLSLVHLVLAHGATVDEVRVDGAPLDRATWSAPFALDPGPHDLWLAAPGKKPRALRVLVATTPGVRDVTVDALEDDHATAPPAVVAPAVATSSTNDAPPPASSTTRPIGFAVLGAGAVALGAGTFFGLRAASKKSDADQHCSGSYCDDVGLALQDDAHSAATISTIAFGAGLVLAGVGTYLVLRAPSPRGAQTASVRIAPTLGGLRIDGRF
jgi:hypothetical protein